MCWNPDKTQFLSRVYAIHECSFLSQHWIIWSAGLFNFRQFRHDVRNVWNFTSQRNQWTALRTNATISAVRNIFRRMKLIHQEVESCEIPFNEKEWFLLYSYFHFVVFLRSFLTRWKNSLSISTIFINYQQLVIAVYINYGSRPSPRCVFMFHGCITSWGVKHLLWYVPVTLISPINRCNILLLS